MSISFANVNTGTTANDGTGTPLRDAFNIINTNFSLINQAGVGNSYNGGTITNSLSVLGGVQNTPIGNSNPSTGYFTSVTTSGGITLQGPNSPIIENGTGGQTGYVLTSTGPTSTPVWAAPTGGNSGNGGGGSGGGITTLSANVLNDLGDVVITSPSNGQVLKYNGTDWVNGTVSSGGGGGNISLPSDARGFLYDNGAGTLSWGSADYTYNVKTRYGATGDGTTNDAAAIQSAINAAIANGGTVFFPAGVYNIGSTSLTCTITNNSNDDTPSMKRPHFLGEGVGASIIKASATSNALVITDTVGSNFGNTYSVISGLSFIGTGTPSPSTIAGGIVVLNDGFVAIRDCEVANFTFGIAGLQNVGFTIDHCIVKNNVTGFYSAGAISGSGSGLVDPNNINFINTTFYKNSQSGVFIRGGSTINMFGGFVYENGINGISLEDIGGDGGGATTAGFNLQGVAFINNGTADHSGAQLNIVLDSNAQANLSSFTTGIVNACSFGMNGNVGYSTAGYINTATAQVNTYFPVTVTSCGFTSDADHSWPAAYNYNHYFPLQFIGCNFQYQSMEYIPPAPSSNVSLGIQGEFRANLSGYSDGSFPIYYCYAPNRWIQISTQGYLEQGPTGGPW